MARPASAPSSASAYFLTSGPSGIHEFWFLGTASWHPRIIRAGLFLFTFLGQNHAYKDMRAAIWIKRLGFWGFLFFLVKVDCG